MRILSTTIQLVAIVILGSLAVAAQSLGDRHVERGGKFSIEPPANWLGERPGGRGFTRFATTSDELFPATLNFTKSLGQLDLDTFVDTTSERMVTEYATVGMDGVDFDSKVRFITKEGLIGRKAVYILKRGESRFISVQYFFIDDRNAKYIIAFTDTADRRAASMQLFDAVAASFKLEP